MVDVAAVERPRPGSAVVSWAYCSIALLALGAWSGYLSYALDFESLAIEALVLLSLLLYGVAHWRLFVAVGDDPNLGREEKARIRGNLKWFGPAAVVQLLLRIHAPASRLAGRPHE
jgi:hypothetical protein